MAESKREQCVCGRLVKGISQKHFDTNLKLHKKGSKHLELMKFKSGDKE